MVIALNDVVYLLRNEGQQSWFSRDATSASVHSLLTTEAQPTSVKASPSGARVVVGTELGFSKLFDVNKQREVCLLNCHKSRVCCLAFNGEDLLTSGSRDASIVTCDVRQRAPPAIAFQRHREEVCSLKWDSFSSYLASGGNDNAVYVWDLRSLQPVRSFKEHTAAVRALGWSPHQFGLLVSGGGCGDKSIKYWNSATADERSVCTVPTDSQVCNLLVSPQSNEMLTTHGFNKNQLMLWNLTKRERLATVEAHQSRVLHAALGPDNESVVTCAADETLKFWKVFERRKQQPSAKEKTAEDRSRFSLR